MGTRKPAATYDVKEGETLYRIKLGGKAARILGIAFERSPLDTHWSDLVMDALELGIEGWALQLFGIPRAHRAWGRIVAIESDSPMSMVVALPPEAIVLASRIGQRMLGTQPNRDRLHKEDQESCSSAWTWLMSSIGEGIVDLEREWLGSRFLDADCGVSLAVIEPDDKKPRRRSRAKVPAAAARTDQVGAETTRPVSA